MRYGVYIFGEEEQEKMKLENKRNDFIDFLKGVGIFLVILGHHENWITGWIYSFHMPLFFMLAGVFHKNEDKYFDFFKKKVKSLLVPYLFFAIILFLFWLIIGRKFGASAFNNTSIRECFIGIFYGVEVKGISSLEERGPIWFLLCLFLISNIFYFLSKLNLKKVIFIEICFIIISAISRKYLSIPLPWNLQRALTDISFYTIGYYTKEFIKNKDKKNNMITLIKGILFILINILIYLNRDKLNILEKYNIDLVYLIGGIFGSFGIIEIFKNIKSNKKIEFIGKNSLILLAFHERAMTGIKFVFIILLNKTLIEGSVLIDIVYSISQVIICIPAILMINKYFYFCIGKKHSR